MGVEGRRSERLRQARTDQRAAEALRVSQPAVAEQVRKLESTLGVDLFARVGRGVVPTEAGAAFAEHAERTATAPTDPSMKKPRRRSENLDPEIEA